MYRKPLILLDSLSSCPHRREMIILYFVFVYLCLCLYKILCFRHFPPLFSFVFVCHGSLDWDKNWDIGKPPGNPGTALFIRSAYFYFALQIFKGFFLFALRGFCVYVHGSAYIAMPHNLLNDFYIGFVLTEPGTKSVPEVVDGRMPDKNRRSEERRVGKECRL